MLHALNGTLTSVASICIGRNKFVVIERFIAAAPGLPVGLASSPSLFARRAKMAGLYVSLMGREAMYTASVTKTIHHCVQRQPLYCAAKPPTTGLTAVNVITFLARISYSPQ